MRELRNSPDPTVPYGRGIRLTGGSVSTGVWTLFNVFDGLQLRGGVTYNSTTATFTVPRTGLYRLEARCLFLPNGTGMRGVAALLNGTLPLYSLTVPGAQSGTAVLVDTVFLNAGDTVQAQCYQDSGVALAFNTNSTGWNAFAITYVGA